MDRQRKVSLCELLYWQDLDHECNWHSDSRLDPSFKGSRMALLFPLLHHQHQRVALSLCSHAAGKDGWLISLVLPVIKRTGQF